MPRLDLDADESMMVQQIAGMQAFSFSGKRIEHLGATEYTLATIAVDLTGSVQDFAKALRDALTTSMAALKKSPRANNLLVRIIFFNSSIGVHEAHGFKPLGDIVVDDYPDFIDPYSQDPGRKTADGAPIKAMKIYGSTNLFDATFNAAGATMAYAKTLMDQEFLTNGILIVITDGDDNASTATTRMIRQEIDKGGKSENIESLISILVAVNAGMYSRQLNDMAKEVGMQYIDIGDATPGKIAKLGQFVSQSVSSQSQSLGTGGPSQNIAATI